MATLTFDVPTELADVAALLDGMPLDDGHLLRELLRELVWTIPDDLKDLLEHDFDGDKLRAIAQRLEAVATAIDKTELPHVACHLRQLRKASGESVEDLAEACGVETFTICGWEEGVRIPDEHAVTLAGRYKCSVEHLIGGGVMSPTLAQLRAAPAEVVAAFKDAFRASDTADWLAESGKHLAERTRAREARIKTLGRMVDEMSTTRGVADHLTLDEYESVARSARFELAAQKRLAGWLQSLGPREESSDSSS